jgi:hypothetical protein
MNKNTATNGEYKEKKQSTRVGMSIRLFRCEHDADVIRNTHVNRLMATAAGMDIIQACIYACMYVCMLYTLVSLGGKEAKRAMRHNASSKSLTASTKDGYLHRVQR